MEKSEIKAFLDDFLCPIKLEQEAARIYNHILREEWKKRKETTMALETLKDVKEIDGFELVHMDNLRETNPEMFHESGQMIYEKFEKDIRPNKFLYARRDKNSITLTMQNGPIKEVGVNGCQVDTLVALAIKIVEGLNRKFPCKENFDALILLEAGLKRLKDRKKDREQRGVEGTNQT